jgi:mRNA interferase HigB
VSGGATAAGAGLPPLTLRRLLDRWLTDQDQRRRNKPTSLRCFIDRGKRLGAILNGQPRASRNVKGGRVVFNVKGNRYRVVVAIRYDFHAVYIRFIGTHADYDKIDAQTV